MNRPASSPSFANWSYRSPAMPDKLVQLPILKFVLSVTVMHKIKNVNLSKFRVSLHVSYYKS